MVSNGVQEKRPDEVKSEAGAPECAIALFLNRVNVRQGWVVLKHGG